MYFLTKTKQFLKFTAPTNYEISKTRKYRNGIGKMENMDYDPESDTYTCKNGRKLNADHIRRSKSKNGYISEKTIYRREDCSGCPYKSECIKGNTCKTPPEERTKTLQVAKTFLKHRTEDLERILSEEGILLRTNRSIQAEGSFGDLKQDKNINFVLLILLIVKTKKSLTFCHTCDNLNLLKYLPQEI